VTFKAAVMASGESAQQSTAQGGIVSSGLTATGNNQATALALPTDFNVFTTVAASTGAILPGAQDTSATPGIVLPTDQITVVNHGANTLSVYPQSGGKIANGSANAAFSVPANKTAFFLYLGQNAWAASVSN
jgi:hypothetical protein